MTSPVVGLQLQPADLIAKGVRSLSSKTTMDLVVGYGVPKSKILLATTSYGVKFNASAVLPPKAGRGAVWLKYGTAAPLLGNMGYREFYSKCYRFHTDESAASSFTLWGAGCSALNAVVGDMYIDPVANTAYAIHEDMWISMEIPQTAGMGLAHCVARRLFTCHLPTVVRTQGTKRTSS